MYASYNSHLANLGFDWVQLGLENKSLSSVGINFKSHFVKYASMFHNLPERACWGTRALDHPWRFTTMTRASYNSAGFLCVKNVPLRLATDLRLSYWSAGLGNLLVPFPSSVGLRRNFSVNLWRVKR